MDSFEKFRSDFWQRMGVPPNGREGFIGGLRRAAEIADEHYGSSFVTEAIEAEAAKIEGE